MIDQSFIEKNKPEERLFEILRKEGIKLIQELCGKVWTDYNVHDPGITILEQVCYAMTELAYRTGFDVADILTREDGKIDFEHQAIFAPHRIFPNQALTPLDYEKLILDSLPEIENIWVEKSGEISGLYRIKIRAEKNISQSKAKTQALIKSVKQVFCKSRNLCEDISDVNMVKNRYCRLYADIEVSGHRNPAHILAQIYDQCATLISPGITYNSRDDLIQQGKTQDEFFTGPLLEHGFMADTPAARKQAFVNISDLPALILSIKGVVSVNSLFLEDCQTHEKYYDIIKQDESGSILCLEFPEEEDHIFVTLSKRLRQYDISLNELTRQYERLKSTHGRLGISTEEVVKSRRLPSGRFRDLGQYHSIMDQFPNSYGINRFGIPPSYPENEKAKAKQLKAYLLFFEQPMANFLETLGNIPDIFSLDPDLDRTSFSRLLDNTNAPEIEQLYVDGPEACGRKLDRIIEQYDNFYDRRNRVLDYLLALYGEKFTQNSLGAFNYYYSERGLARWFIKNKIKFLTYLPEISSKRASGYNYRQTSWNTENIAGLKLKTSILLGFQLHHSRSLTIAFTRHGLELIPDANLSELNHGTVEIQYVTPGDIAERIETPFQRIEFKHREKNLNDTDIQSLFKKIIFLKSHFLNESSMKNGLDFNNYRIGQISDDTWQIIFKPHAKSRWCYLSSHRHRDSAIRSANHLRCFIKTLNIMSEGMHLVEHLLLRPEDISRGPSETPDDFFFFRVSAVFPSWTARCANPGFRQLAEETVRINAPAHIAVDFYWLGFQQMLEFEILYHDWLEKKKAEKNSCPETQKLANRIVRFLIKHKSRKSTTCFL
ncbi:hypothetical protein [Desulfobacula phenolica]|uniref:Uncharacterized protein n=1 Tax=Desulfobacula phenolica TaxID=90732 RepID=A0A1H2JPX1_9BACT|nr:hypothetical protein [Desulfobacula phenolica]SDU58363.1 hypothetical protein SAMN04487931_11421 [Desulfobacula phenolica]